MATTYIKTVYPVNIKELQNKLNESVDISSTCISVSEDTSLTVSNVTIEWSVSLTQGEETEQDIIISNYVYVPQQIDVNLLPFSELGNKLAIHSSTKPAKDDKEFYLVWTGAGDDVTGSPPLLGDGEIIQFALTTGAPSKSIEVRFAPEYGDVYVHEGYAKWENGGIGDYITASVISEPTILQTSNTLDLEVVNNWVKFASGGAGTGTHGFAATPTLIRRSLSKDGDWDYDETNGLIPNTLGTGEYKISDIERSVHRYINKIPTNGSSYGYTRLTSDETAYLPAGYFLRITAYNISDSTWNCCVFMEVFRERTAVP